MPLGNIIERPVKQMYKTRDRYLLSTKQDEPKFCHLMGSNPKPWLTLVMGSGCATSTAQEKALLERANQFVGRIPVNKSIPNAIEGQPIGEAVSEFATDLICDRLRIQRLDLHNGLVDDSTTNATISAQAVPEWIFELFVFTAVSSRLYFRIKSLSFSAPRRPDRSDDAVLDDGSRVWGTLLGSLITPCRRVLAALQNHVNAEVDGRPPLKTERLKDILSHVMDEIAPKLSPSGEARTVTVSVADLRALTEFAWFCFTDHTTPKVYPGWSDLLLYLSSYTSAEPVLGVPRFPKLTDAQSLIKTRYKEVTKKSWDIICDNGLKQTGLHFHAAELLNTQDRFYQHKRKLNPPRTTAFITSFDLELELALLHQGKAFNLVMPIHVLAGKVAHTCWISVSIPPKEEREKDCLAYLTESKPVTWKLLTQSIRDKGPFVIRLAGCPLFHLPKTFKKLHAVAPQFSDDLFNFVRQFLPTQEQGDPEDRDKEDVKESLQLQHAVVINEHDAITQSAIDFIWDPHTDPHGPSWGLPAEFAAGATGWSRFWMLLGVQIHDSAVRHRITTLISSLPITVGSKASGTGKRGSDLRSDKASAMMRNGVAVNKNLSPLEEDLLFWSGFDIVAGNITDFAGDLHHYKAHLESEDTQFPDSEACSVS